MRGVLIALAVVVLAALGILYVYGRGLTVETPRAGEPEARAVASELVSQRERAQLASAVGAGVSQPKQILFGDLHVHTTFSFDAFQMSLPMAGGDGAHSVADACDFARHCAALDFWSINDHAISLTPRRWRETVDSIRACNAVAGDPANPDLVSYIGWEWTQVGSRPEIHYGHKNVILRDLDDDAIPTRPIAAGIPEGMPTIAEAAPSPFLVGFLGLAQRTTGGPEFARYLDETASVPDCEFDVPVRDLPIDCRELARTPKALFAKLDDWGHASLVIPHGTSWGFYTPLGSAWDKQIAPGMHDPARQKLVEVFSGHGNSEEFRAFEEVVIAADGSKSCPEPSDAYLPGCWRAGEIIEARCLDVGESADECGERAAEARQNFVEAVRNAGAATVPAWTAPEWQDAGQCRDCFQPSFNHRPRSSVQYLMALGRPGQSVDRFRMGFIASSDNHSARPGTGYKEVARTEFTEQRFGNFSNTVLGERPDERPEPRSQAFVDNTGNPAIFSIFETERQASFFLSGGLAAAHSAGRDRGAVWDALQRREVYGTSGPRILLWFDLLNAPGGAAPMGSEVTIGDSPIFQVRAVGSFEQKPGCPADASEALTPERLARLCLGECYHPSDQRRPITRIEVVRIRPQRAADEDVAPLIQDPWKVMQCSGDADGCMVAFTDPEFVAAGRDALYYVRAIEAPSQAVAADPLGCTRNAAGRCVDMHPCWGRPDSDECLAETEERAWSSPIFLGYAGS